MDRKWWSLIAVCTGTFMLLLDITIVNVALPSIETSLDATFSQLQWVVDAYALTLAALLLTAGSLADRFGRRRVFAVGLVLFTSASFMCGIATSPMQLIISRAAQGVGGAAMFATSLALLAAAFHGRDRGVAFGVWGATTGLAVAIGPLLGGILTEWIGWEWIFFINIPLGIATIYMTLRRVAESHNPQQTRIDWLGAVTFSAGLFVLVWALIEGNSWGWYSQRVDLMLAGSAALVLCFVLIQVRGIQPMFDMTLFRNRTFVGASIVAFTLSGSMFAMFLYLVLFLQVQLHLSPLEAGIRFLPISLVSFFAAAASGRLSESVPVRVLMGSGLLCVTAGLALMHGISVGDSWLRLLPGFVVSGVGIGLVNPALASTAIGVVPPQQSGVASGMNSTFRQIGIATGIAGLGAVFQHQVTQGVVDRLRDTPLRGRSAELAERIARGDAGDAIASAGSQASVVELAARSSFFAGLNQIIAIAAVVALVGALACIALVRSADFHVRAPEVLPEDVLHG